MEFQCFIDGCPISERVFWSKLSVLASPQQTHMIMDGFKVLVAESLYWMEKTQE